MVVEVDPFGAGGGSNKSSVEELAVQEGDRRREGGVPRISFQMGQPGLEERGETEVGAGGSRGGLDVDAFRRLLLTGQTGGSTPARSSADLGRAEERAGTEITIQLQDTPRLSREIPGQTVGDEQQRLLPNPPAATLQPAPTILRKKPPPPSSRHGKLIRPDPTRQESSSSLGGKTSSSSSLASPKPVTSPSRQRPPTPSDVNKPLPSQPSVSEDGNIFDHEAAGKIPEPAMPDPGLHIIHALRSPSPTSSLPTPPPSRKPAPPPRRQPHHGRSEPRPFSPEEELFSSTRRSSMESTRSRSSSLRANIHAPAPPPPRRPSQRVVASPSGEAVSPPPTLSGSSTPNNNSVVTPPLAGSVVEAIASPPPVVGTAKEKLTPPPPPPARGASVRAKKPVGAAGEGVVRRSSGNSKQAPPVPKHRGGGGSVRNSAMAMATAATPDTTDEVVVSSPGGGGSGDGVDILADLTRLQREVDELRAGLANGGSK